MVRQIFGVFKNEVKNLHSAAYLLGIFALLSQVLSLFRDRLLAHYFGAGATLDVYYASFRIPDLIFVSVASLVSMSVLIPYFQEKLKDSKEEAKEFIDQMFSSFSIIISVVCLVAFIIMPMLISWLYGNWSDVLQAQTVSLSRILLLSPIFLGISNLLACITQSYKRFIVYASAPLIYNISTVFGLAVLYPKLGIAGVACGVVLGALFHAIIQIPFVKSVGFSPDFVFPIKLKSIFNISKISLPRTLALSLSNIALIILFSLASKISEGSVAVFNLSYNLQSVPLTIIAVSYSMAAFPVLSKFFVDGEKRKFMDQMATAAKHIIFLSIPIAVFFIVLRAQAVRTILGSGQFSWEDTRLTAACLALFSLSVVFQGLSLLLIRGFYAGGMTRIPLYINSLSAVLMVLFPFLLLKIFLYFPFIKDILESLLRIKDVAGSSVIAIPLGYSFGAAVNAILLFVIFQRKFGLISSVIKRPTKDTLIASLCAGFASYLALQFFQNILDLNTFIGIATQGTLSGLIGIAVWAGILWLIKNKEFGEIASGLRGKFLSTKPIVSEPTDL